MNSEETTVTFTLDTEKTGTFTYYLKVTADGGEIFWSEQKSFATQCGSESAGINGSNDFTSSTFTINGDDPSFTIETFTQTSEVCKILSYELYSNTDDSSLH